MLPFLGFWSLLCVLGYLDFTRLPVPLPSTSNTTNEHLAASQIEKFSEGNAMKITEVLAKDIGMRLVGSPQESMTINFLMNHLILLKNQSRVDFTIEKQQASGSHRFDFMFEPVIKTYSNITNLIVTLSCKTCSPDALLMNSHFDSTIVSPGAADDAASVAIMLELLRIISQDSGEKLRKTLIFLFNGAEETLQDASHAFLTQHPLASRVKAVINMEAMGAQGQEILFQANSPYLISKYASVPHPHASSLSNDVFKTGLLLSDTDYRQFMQYGRPDLIGLDFAFYKNSYHYHTNLDVVEKIEKGSIQHFGDNVLELIKQLAWNDEEWDMERESGMVYFVYPMGLFIYYSRWASVLFHGCIVLMAVQVCRVYGKEILQINTLQIISTGLWCLGSLAAGICTACLYGAALGFVNPMSWFSSEFYAILCFGIPFLLGLLLFSLAFSSRLTSWNQTSTKGHVCNGDGERTLLLGFTLLFALLLGLTTWAELASSYLLLFHTVFLMLGLIADYIEHTHRHASSSSSSFKRMTRGIDGHVPVSPLAYCIIMIPVVSFGAVTGLSIIYVFVPITGRIGLEAPVDLLIPCIVSIAMIMSQSYLLLPISHRSTPHQQKKATKGLGVVSLAIATLFCLFISPYTSSAPKRLYISFLENGTAHERGVHVSFADRARRTDVVRALEHEFSTTAQKRSAWQTDRDWATLFPFSRFVEGYYLDLTTSYPTPLRSISQDQPKTPYLSSTSTNHPNGTKSIHLTCHYTGFVWSVISFKAVVLGWSLKGMDPIEGKDHYTIRHVGGHGGTEWSIDLLVNTTGSVDFEVSGVEREGFEHLIPAHKVQDGYDGSSGFQWLWSDHFESAVALRRCNDALPNWTTYLLVGIVTASHTVQ